MSRYKLIIQYDGAAYSGWQTQKYPRTVQGELEKVLTKIFNQKIKVYGSGRTDTGVHAWAQVAHIDLNTSLKDYEIKNAMNSNLPIDCRIMDVKPVDSDFHSRFHARKRIYRYQCISTELLLYRNQCWILSELLDLDLLNELSSKILGTHDFLSFCKFNPEISSTVCEVYISEWICDGNMIVYKSAANRYLHHMIRYLVGSMIAVNAGRLSQNDFYFLIKKPRKSVKIFKAPPQGLILEQVIYD